MLSDANPLFIWIFIPASISFLIMNILISLLLLTTNLKEKGFLSVITYSLSISFFYSLAYIIYVVVSRYLISENTFKFINIRVDGFIGIFLSLFSILIYLLVLTTLLDFFVKRLIDDKKRLDTSLFLISIVGGVIFLLILYLTGIAALG